MIIHESDQIRLPQTENSLSSGNDAVPAYDYFYREVEAAIFAGHAILFRRSVTRSMVEFNEFNRGIVKVLDYLFEHAVSTWKLGCSAIAIALV